VLNRYRVTGGAHIKLSDFPTGIDDKIKRMKDELVTRTQENLEKMEALQEKLYAQGEEGLVIVLQAMDAAGKDSTVSHVMGGFNPQGVSVHSFKAPSVEELAHDFLWRIAAQLPPRGQIAIFNRSHYEDVLVVKVHHLQATYRMPKRCLTHGFIQRRYSHIRHFEDYLFDNGYRVIKLFLHMSNETQRKRLLARIDTPDKHWKYSSSDLPERELWGDYQQAYEDAINHTATEHSPWFVIPSDKKWFSRYLVSEALVDTLLAMAPEYPEVTPQALAKMDGDREQLMSEAKAGEAKA